MKFIKLYTCMLAFYTSTAEAKSESTTQKVSHPSQYVLPAMPTPPQEKVVKIDIDGVDSESLLKQLAPALAAQNVDSITKILTNDTATLEVAHEVIQNIIMDRTSPLDRYHKVILLFALATTPHFTDSQDFLFELLADPAIGKNDEPLLWIATEDPIALKGTAHFVDFAKKNFVKFGDVAYDAVERTIADNDPEALKALMPHILPTENQATDFLWHVVRDNKDAAFIPLLKKLGADLDATQDAEYSGTKTTSTSMKQTPLMYAAGKTTGSKLIQALLTAGANKKLTPGIEGIDARFIAMEKGVSSNLALLEDANEHRPITASSIASARTEDVENE